LRAHPEDSPALDDFFEMIHEAGVGGGRIKVENVATYFTKCAAATGITRLDGDDFRERGWPIASGTVEGGHASWWDDFWSWVKERGASEKYAAAAWWGVTIVPVRGSPGAMVGRKGGAGDRVRLVATPS
jgi:hypothetical protein